MCIRDSSRSLAPALRNRRSNRRYVFRSNCSSDGLLLYGTGCDCVVCSARSRKLVHGCWLWGLTLNLWTYYSEEARWLKYHLQNNESTKAKQTRRVQLARRKRMQLRISTG